MASKRRSAFTLLELILVAAIGAILLGLAYPMINRLSRGQGLTGKDGQKAAVDNLRTRLADARSRAMEEGRAYRVGIVPNKGNYRVAPDDDSFWDKGGASNTGSSTPKPLVLAGALPQGSWFQESDNGGGSNHSQDEVTAEEPDKVGPGTYQPLVTFLPDGTARDDGKIKLATFGTAPILVKIQGLTGVTTTQEE